eukprot:TRINITY_DN17227_c0_g1_i1.p1 TRINITY_DN17227_c0_g1~~TRINITY_DN17227_c0_g1_i1.p1  ORF type:complete len:397 (+),score=77.99 TRINITY_DN17227_c0_g1_i1:548-1738(+)
MRGKKRITTHKCQTDSTVLSLRDELFNISTFTLPSVIPSRFVLLISGNETFCQISETVKPNNAASPFPLIAGLTSGICFLGVLCLVMFHFYRKNKKEAAYLTLPPEVQSHIKQFYKEKIMWEKEGQPSFYKKMLSFTSHEGQKVQDLLLHYLSGEKTIIREMYAVVNPTLLKNFISTRTILEGRSKETDSSGTPWRSFNKKEKEIVWEIYSKLVHQYPWNKDSTVPIIPAVHGTDMNTAWQICSTGFAALSSLDAGYYGKGIYFSTHVDYILPYYATKPNPAIIISYLVPGNIFPVTENHKRPGSLRGTALKSGYQSHYVVTERKGSIPNLFKSNVSGKKLFDELVIGKKTQILPAYFFLVYFKQPSLFGAFVHNSTKKKMSQKKKKKKKKKSTLR